MGQFFQIQDLGAIAPEVELAMFGMIVLIADLLIIEKRRIGWIALFGIACSGVFVQAIPKMMFCISTDLPLPVDPAISVCGALDFGERNKRPLSSSFTAISS